MNRTVRFILIAGILVFAVGATLILSQRSRTRNAVTKYKAELRAQGEKLSAAELGYPRLPEPSESLDQLQAGLGKMVKGVWQPGMLEVMRYVSAGRVRACWAKAQPQVYSWAVKTNPPSWEDLTAQFAANAEAMAEIREATQHPPRWFYNDPTNLANRTMSPFVTMRSAAQSLADDTVVALHARELDRAQDDIQALIQLAQFNREDLTLVSQMIRVAIAGLGLAVTWEALQEKGWSKDSLAALQNDWEAVNLEDALATGLIGQRALGEAFFASVRSVGPSERAKFLKSGFKSAWKSKSFKDYMDQLLPALLWNGEADELFFLKYHQECLDAIRQSKRGLPWPELKARFKAFDTAMSEPLAKYRYRFSNLAIPNSRRAAKACVQNETQRRLTVTAIAIERYTLRNGHPPPDLDALVPQFLSTVPIDLMSAKPLRYKLNPNDSFVLYSVGEDGRDDGGDPNPASATNKFDLWSGKDAVWPTAVFETRKAE
jgi:hypothetical protein